MAWLLLIPALLLADANAPNIPPAELVRSAIRARQSFRGYELSAQAQSDQVDKKTGAVTKLRKDISSFRSDARFRVDYRSENRETQAFIKHHTVCRGCVADEMLHYFSHSEGTRAACRGGSACVFEDMLVDLAMCGVCFAHVENLLPRTFAAFENSRWEEPTFRPLTEHPGMTSVHYSLKGSPATRTIVLDPARGDSIVEMRFAANDGTGEVTSVKSFYEARQDGIHFPNRVVYHKDTPQYSVTETVTFTKAVFNRSGASDAFSPAAVGLRYNSHVQDITPGAKTVSKYFDGVKLVDSPPDVAEYIPGTPIPPESRPSWWGTAASWAGAAVLIGFSLLLFRRWLKARR